MHTWVGTLTRLPDGRLDYRYELNDQLGNARLIYHAPTTATYTATLETAVASQEEQAFTNVASTRFAAPGHNGSARVARLGLGSGLALGPGKTLSVQRGDTVTFTAYAWLTAAIAASATQPPMQAARSTSSLVVLAAPLNAPAVAPLSAGVEQGRGGGSSLLPRLGLGVALPFGGPRPVASALSGTGSSGNARLHYLVKDQDGTVVLDDYQNANPGTPGTWQPLQVGLRLAQGGTVELRVETEGASGPAVYFDDVEIQHTASTIVQEQHQYAYGAPMGGLNYTVGGPNYRHGYQGQFAEKDVETGWEAFELRQYDARIGRWTAPDPAGQYDSPYVGMGNDPVSSIDPDGGFDFGAIWGSIKAGLGFGRMMGSSVAGNLRYVAQASAAWQSIGNAVSAVGRGVATAAPYALQVGVGGANSWLLYNGTSLNWYNGNSGDKSHLLASYKATSGATDYQNSSNQRLKDVGPVPVGNYSINLALRGDRVASIASDGSNLAANYGIEKINKYYPAPNEGEVYDLSRWGTMRARLETPAGRDVMGRNNFYLHNSHKGFSHGCIEVPDFHLPPEKTVFGRLAKYGRSHSKISLVVRYPGANVSTNGGTEYK